jgi:hypothetical protein
VTVIIPKNLVAVSPEQTFVKSVISTQKSSKIPIFDAEKPCDV